MATEWRRRRWRRLLNIIDRLPRTSAYVEAMADDDELAAQMAGRELPKRSASRRMSDWSVPVELLTAILNRLGELTQAVAVLGGAKPHRLTPAPTPVTALERVRKHRRETVHESLVARLLPGRDRPG